MTNETDHTTLSRRNLLLGAAGAAAGSVVATTNTASAKAPLQGAAPVDHRRVKLGAFEVTTVADGFAAVPKVHPIFGNNQKPEDVAAHMQANFLPGDKMAIPFTPVIVNTGNELVLFDAGNGGGRGATRGQLVNSITAAGFTPDQIDVVVITHFHPDHIGGIMNGDKPTFPNARYVAGETEFNFWMSDKVQGSTNKGMQGRLKFVNGNVKPDADKMTFVKNGNDVVTGITAIEAFGHTPGHTVFNIESNGQRLVLFGDISNHYVASMQKPEWHVIFDMDKDKAVESRKKILGMVAADKVPATGYHMPFPAIGYVEQKGDAFNWVPHSYQLDL
jgi:glyoxylase-like metal-dependent hydrolase (beta-lactamase superfamily II)